MCILYPPATPWVIAGGVAAGALAEGGMEVYKESKTGEYDWRKILIKTLGGSLKGALAASPLKPLATGLGVATTGAIEDYIYCIANGETHEQALKSAAINGPIEGLTVGGCKWLGNALASKIKVKKLPETNPKPISGELPEGTTGSLKINIQLFAEERKETVDSAIFEEGKKIFDKFNIADAYVKPKHLSTTTGNARQFLGSTKEEAQSLLREAMKEGKIISIIDDGISKLGQRKYAIILDAGKIIGTRGETFVKVILSSDGGMLSAYPRIL